MYAIQVNNTMFRTENALYRLNIFCEEAYIYFFETSMPMGRNYFNCNLKLFYCARYNKINKRCSICSQTRL